MQRRGRVGRLSEGTCYHLLTKKQFDSLKDYPEPDILTQDISMELIKIMMFTEERTFDSGLELLNELMDVPSRANIDVAYNIFSLYKIIDENNHLTKIGTDISNFSSLPINRALFLIYSFQMYCGREACGIAAMIEHLKGNVTNMFFKGDTTCESGIRNKKSIEYLKSVYDKKGDHYTFMNIYMDFYHSEDRNEWANQRGIRRDIMFKIKKSADGYFNRLKSLAEVPQMSRAKDVEARKKIKEALKYSHIHLSAKNLTPEYPPEKHKGQISKNSSIHASIGADALKTRRFIYDELACISGSWEFNVITIVK